MKHSLEMFEAYPRKLITMALIAALLLALLPSAVPPATAAPELDTFAVYISDVRDNSFVVSWTTDELSDGHIDWGLSTALGNTRTDPVASTTTHYLTMAGLSPSITYYFQIRSGEITDNNGGAYYSVTTGPTLSIPSPEGTIYGTLYQSNGTTPVPNAIVYIQLQDNNGSGSLGNSQWVSARTDGSGVWYYELSNVRTANAGAYYDFSNGTDNMRLVWQGGVAGCIGEQPGDLRIYPMPTGYPAEFIMNLDAIPNVVILKEFTTGQKTGAPLALLVSGVVLGGGILSWGLWKERRLRQRVRE